MSDLGERDRRSVWHPYSPLGDERTLSIVRAEGSTLFTDDGEPYFDAISSWWTVTLGHGRPEIAEAVARQIRRLDHVVFASATHEPAVELAERLLSAYPGGMDKVFFSDDGSTAVEVALKIALQSERNRGSNRSRFIAFQGGYHGDTFGAMSLAGRGTFNRPFEPLLFEVESIPPPTRGRERESLDRLDQALDRDDVVGFIFEPLLQGSAGMIVHSAEWLSTMIERCRSAGVVSIADEVMTGFGRTGVPFACERLTATVDLACLSKGLTGGVLPLGATLCSAELVSSFQSSDRRRMLLHGHSFTGNPIACAAAIAHFDAFQTAETKRNIARIEARHRDQVEQMSRRCEQNSALDRVVADVRSLGTMFALDLRSSAGDRDPTTGSSYYSSRRDRLYDGALRRGALIRPLGDTLYLLPPYCTTDDELDSAYRTIVELATDEANR
jgi:adenosylmethionine-8-amino-7-oxononanoate aminotransferase